MSTAKGNVFSCDLAANAKHHLLFLKQCHLWMTSFDYNEPSFLIESLRRYQTLWLPLVASDQTRPLIPPPDLAWLWHCHRLAPKQYCDYCVSEFGCIVEANPPFVVALTEDPVEGNPFIATSQELWKDCYPNEPFFLHGKMDRSDSTTVVKVFPKIGGFDLLESTLRQGTFLWQVSGERFSDDAFLVEGVENYTKFLLLNPKAMQQRITLIPTYQIDLMWHTHMLTSMQQYHDDCLRIMHSRLYHDDSLTDRSDGGVLDVSYRATQELWLKEYGKDYVVCGGMYRGEPPDEYYTLQTSLCTLSGGEVSNRSAPVMNQHLIGKVGATSTSPRPKQWASIKGFTSDSRPAFMRTVGQTRDDVKGLPYLENYVLGRIHGRTGYYHIETKEAHYILLRRVQARIRSAQCDMACQPCQWAFQCCIYPDVDAEFKEKLAALLDTEEELKERLLAPSPDSGFKRKSEGTPFCGHNGAWLYAPIYANAGGSCGGAVAADAGLGGAGCGASYGDGGGGGGGGGGGCACGGCAGGG